jgi:zinc transport system ATP-binding protein
MDKPLLSVSDLKVQFENQVILDNVSFEVKKNQTLAIIGPNGAGKTVLFRALLGLIPFKGSVVWEKGIKVGYVPQRLSLERDLPLTVNEFLSLKEKSEEKKEKVLSRVGFGKEKDFSGKKLGILSGGQLQRVLIAFALLGEPEVLLFGEPTAGIDLTGEETIYSLLHKLQEKQKLTIILISHELQVVYRYADTVMCLNKEKVCFGPPKEVLNQESLEKIYGHETGYYHHHEE